MGHSGTRVELASCHQSGPYVGCTLAAATVYGVGRGVHAATGLVARTYSEQPDRFV